MNRMCASVTLQEIPENPLPGSEDGGPVLGCVTFGLNLAKFWIIVDTQESMTCQVACKGHTGALQNGTGLRIELHTEEDPNPKCPWAPSRETSHAVEYKGSDRTSPQSQS